MSDSLAWPPGHRSVRPGLALWGMVFTVQFGGCTDDGRSAAADHSAAARATKTAVAPARGDELPPVEKQGVARAGGLIRVVMDSEPPSLNYQLDPPDATGQMVHQLIYDSLARPHPQTFVAEPRLARSWQVSADRLHFTFQLRAGVRWHDGEPFTADDVLFTFATLLNPRHHTNAIRSFLEPLKGVRKISPTEVRFELKRPYWYAFDAVSGITIYPKHLMAGGDFNHHPLNRAPVGTGPYRFERWKAGESISLRRNDDYFAGPVKPDGLQFIYVPEAASRIQLVRRGEVDVVLRVPPQHWAALMEDSALADRYWRLRHIPNGMQWIGWNNRRPPFNDRRVRRAMTLLLDRDDIVNNLRLGVDAKTASWFYPGAKEYNSALSPLPHDPARAAVLLAEAGWRDSDKDGVPFQFEFVYPAGPPFYEQLAGLMRQEFRRAGIEVRARKVEWTVYLGRLSRGDFGACSLLWQLSPRGDPYQIWHSGEAEKGSNYVAFAHPTADELLQEARGLFDEAARLRLYRRFSEILQQEQPYTMLFSRYNLSLVSKRLGGVVSSPYGIIRLESLFLRAQVTGPP